MHKLNRQRGATIGRVIRTLAPASAIAALALTTATPALAHAGGGYHRHHHYRYPVALVAVTPGPGDTAGAGGAFNIDLALLARNSAGDDLLSAANGYHPGLNLPPAPTAAPGKPDPTAPGLVVTLSSTPAAAGGPAANLAGLFQENAVPAAIDRHTLVPASAEDQDRRADRSQRPHARCSGASQDWRTGRLCAAKELVWSRFGVGADFGPSGVSERSRHPAAGTANPAAHRSLWNRDGSLRFCCRDRLSSSPVRAHCPAESAAACQCCSA